MPTTENATVQRIQQEIRETVQREKELRTGYSQLNGNSHSFDNNYNNNDKLENMNGYSGNKPVLQRAQSTSTLSATAEPQKNGFRRFTPNQNAKGVMQRFIKSRGKLNITSIQANGRSANSWTNGDAIIEPARVTVEPGKRIRNGYVPVEERMRKEVQEYTERERELRSERRKSQPDLMAVLNVVESPKPEKRTAPLLRSAKSVTQLFDPDELPEDTASAPSSLKPARSLADLLDIDQDDSLVQTPGTHSLILQFEKMNQKNGQDRT